MNEDFGAPELRIFIFIFISSVRDAHAGATSSFSRDREAITRARVTLRARIAPGRGFDARHG